MSPKCQNCGWEPTRGRPKKLDDKKILKLALTGWSLQALATQFKVTRGAIQAAIKRARLKQYASRRTQQVTHDE